METFVVGNQEPTKPLDDDNKLKSKDRAAHDWYRFVLSFPPHLVQRYLTRFGANSTSQVLDPFCGTGTTVVECKKLGIPSVGVEAIPILKFASSVKLDWEIDPKCLLEHACDVAELATKKIKSEGIEGIHDLPLFNNTLRGLDEDVQKLLLKNSISPLPLHKTLILKEIIQQRSNPKFINHERLALAKALVNGISNLRFGPEIGVGSAKSDAPVIEIWLDGMKAIANDLKILQMKDYARAVVHQADSRHLSTVLEEKSIDIVITSPPYPNEKDYTRTTRLESVILGFLDDRQGLRSLKDALLRSNTRGVYKDDTDDLLVADHEEIQKIAESIENRRIELGKTSGFERLYARLTKLYFGGMYRHLADLRHRLRPGAQLAYVVGDQASYLRIMIRTGQLIADIAQSLGYEVVDIDLFRTRLSTATKEQLKEEVVLLRWPGEIPSRNETT